MLLRVLIIIAFVLIAAIVALYLIGKKTQKKQADTQKQIEETSQLVTILVIDKKKIRLKDANLPQIVLDNAPRLAKVAKMPIVKAKIGPKVVDLLCDDKVFNDIPIKEECKVMLSGMFITSLKNVRGKITTEKPKKKAFFKK